MGKAAHPSIQGHRDGEGAESSEKEQTLAPEEKAMVEVEQTDEG